MKRTYVFSGVSFGLAGNGYLFTANRVWVTAILLALKETAVLSKPTSGLDPLVSSFINGAASYLGEEVTDRVVQNAGAAPETGGQIRYTNYEEADNE